MGITRVIVDLDAGSTGLPDVDSDLFEINDYGIPEPVDYMSPVLPKISKSERVASQQHGPIRKRGKGKYQKY